MKKRFLLAAHTACSVISYWHDTVVCLSVCLWRIILWLLAKWYILWQWCLHKWIWSPLEARFKNFQPPTNCNIWFGPIGIL